MKVLLTGASGLLGGYLVSELKDDYELVLISHQKEVLGVDCDITDESAVERIFDSHSPEIVIHAAAISDVDFCHNNPGIAHSVNAIGTLNLAYHSSKSDATFVYISTDYVFNGDKHSPYTEEDEPHPETIYGETKYAGEHFVSYFSEKYYTLRTGLLYGDNNDPLRDICSRLKSSLGVDVADNQFISPTYALDFARCLKEFLSKVMVGEGGSGIAYGIYHLANKGELSRYELALKVAEICNLESIFIKPFKLSEISITVKRPEYSVLSVDKFERATGLEVRPCVEALVEYL
ncbi:MAG: NAD(P)-dependent oxidoreductase [Candidatus Kaelpia aquatica]|nr:NAD(P)-dependent oxidoreductase [Candidatus Kaelpia aquatica]